MAPVYVDTLKCERQRKRKHRIFLWLERNNAWINGYMPLAVLVLMSNMDIQKINTFDALISYLTKYQNKFAAGGYVNPQLLGRHLFAECFRIASERKPTTSRCR